MQLLICIGGNVHLGSVLCEVELRRLRQCHPSPCSADHLLAVGLRTTIRTEHYLQSWPPAGGWSHPLLAHHQQSYPRCTYCNLSTSRNIHVLCELHLSVNCIPDSFFVCFFFFIVSPLQSKLFNKKNNAMLSTLTLVFCVYASVSRLSWF